MMTELQNFFDLEALSNLLNGSQNMILVLAVIGLAFISIFIFLFLLSSEKKRFALRNKLNYQSRILSAKLAQTEAVLASDEQLLLIWKNQSDMLIDDQINNQSARMLGRLQNVIGLPKTVIDILKFSGWLDEAGAKRTQKSLIELVKDGIEFRFFVKTKAIERVEISGHVVGQEIIFRIRDLKEDRLFLARANEKWTMLENKADQYDALLNVCPLPSWLRNDDGKLSWVNDAYINAVEAEDAANVVQDNIELIAPADVYKARQYFEMPQKPNIRLSDRKDIDENITVIDDKHIEQQVFAVIKGERCNIKISHEKIEGGTVSIAYDMTSYERVKDELKRYNNAHKQTLDKLKTAIAQFGPDQKLEFYNASYQELFGLPSDFLDSKPNMSAILDELRNLKKMPEQVNFKSWRNDVLQAFRQVEPKENQWHLPNGTTLNIIADPHPFGGVTFLYDDVTEQMTLEMKYNTLDKMQAETLDNLADGVAVFNADGELQISNPAFAKIWNFEPSQLVGKRHVNELLNQCQSQSEEGAIWGGLKTSVTAITDKRDVMNGRVICTNGNIVEYASIPLPNGSTLMTFTDVTIVAKSTDLLKERNDALVAADEFKSDFISHVSYQFREPLTNILGFSEMLENQTFGNLNDKQMEYVDIIRSSSFGLRALINDILDLASLDAAHMALQYSKISVTELIENAVERVKMLVGQKNIVLNRIIMPSIGEFDGDNERVAQVLYNLLINAIYYSDKDSIVSIGAEKENDVIRLWVRDAGIGISEDRVETIFERFNSDKPNGAGLGLTLVKELVEFHSGQVKVSSELGKGTIVSCYFPLNAVKKETTLAVELPTVTDSIPKLTDGIVQPKLDQKPNISPREQLKLMREKTVKAAKETEEIVLPLIDVTRDRATNTTKVNTDNEDNKGIFGNSRLAALYQRSENKKNQVNDKAVDE